MERKYRKHNFILLFVCVMLFVAIFNTGFVYASYYKYSLEKARQPEKIEGFMIQPLYSDHMEPNPFSSDIHLSSFYEDEGYISIENKTDERLIANLRHEDGNVLIYTVKPGITYCSLSEGDGEYEVICGKEDETTELHHLVETSKNDDSLFLYPNSYVMFEKGDPILRFCAKFPSDNRRYMDAVCRTLADRGVYTVEGDRMETWYVPDANSFISDFRGDCFDFASYVCSAFRIKGIPCRIAVGDHDGEGHAWIEVKPDFDGSIGGFPMKAGQWCFMDPTIFVTTGVPYNTLSLSVPTYIRDNYKEYVKTQVY